MNPKCSLWIATNEPPSLRLVDKAMKRRLRIWPFVHSPEEPDTNLSATLRSPAIMPLVLQWALEGARKYAELGHIPECAAVQEATSEYFTSVDTIGAWLKANTEPSEIPDYDTSAKAAYADYREWCESESTRPLPSRTWGISMTRMIENRHTRRGKLYGIMLTRVTEGDG